MDLQKMREDDKESELVSFALDNLHRLKQAEQDSLNLVLSPKILNLSPNFLICTYLYDMIKKDDDGGWLTPKVFENPVQIHYATHIKPWNTPTCTHSHLWFSYLARTPFFYEVMERLLSPKERQLPNGKWYLFNKIEILKIKDGKIRLFGIFRLGQKQ